MRQYQAPSYVTVDAGQCGRRIDNFLLACLKGLPRSRAYQMLRRGEVRVNKGRIRPDYRLQEGDVVRIPPVFELPSGPAAPPPERLVAGIKPCVIHEDDRLIVIDKPAGLSVHAGSGCAFGVIELLRAVYQQELHLAHRLDKETSGCLLVAKDPGILRKINLALKNGEVKKEYEALVQGRLRQNSYKVDRALQRSKDRSGEAKVRLDQDGKTALSEFEKTHAYQDATRVRVRTGTGRTHQIRVHAGAIGHPLAGDGRYGNREFNRKMRQLGLRRMFLHAGALFLPTLQDTGPCRFHAPLPADLEAVLARLE